MDERAFSAALLMTRTMTRTDRTDLEKCREFLSLPDREKHEFVKTMTPPQVQLCLRVMDEYSTCKTFLLGRD